MARSSKFLHLIERNPPVVHLSRPSTCPSRGHISGMIFSAVETERVVQEALLWKRLSPPHKPQSSPKGEQKVEMPSRLSLCDSYRKWHHKHNTLRLTKLLMIRDEMRLGELYAFTFPTHSGHSHWETLGERALGFESVIPSGCKLHKPFQFHLILLFKDRASHSPGWPQTHDPPASASLVLGLQACTLCYVILYYLFLKTRSHYAALVGPEITI